MRTSCAGTRLNLGCGKKVQTFYAAGANSDFQFSIRDERRRWLDAIDVFFAEQQPGQRQNLQSIPGHLSHSGEEPVFLQLQLAIATGPGTPGTSYTALGTNLNVTPGAQTSFPWNNLQANKTYEWYVTVSDSLGNVWISSASRFKAIANSAPVATNRFLNIVGDQPSSLTLVASDANGDPLTFRTNSQPTRGLITNFNLTNGTFVYTPARSYRGADQFSFQAFDGSDYSAVATLTLNVTSPADTNSNGLPDSWEVSYNITDPNADDDGDGQNNLAEYVANTDPKNSASVLRMLEAVQTNGTFRLSWPATSGTRYRVQLSTNEISGPFNDIVRSIDLEMAPNPYGSNSVQSFIEPISAANNARFYRIKVVP